MEQAPWLQRVSIAVLIALAPGFKAFSMVSIKFARYLSVKKCLNNLKKNTASGVFRAFLSVSLWKIKTSVV